jgi:hypothetical protein
MFTFHTFSLLFILFSYFWYFFFLKSERFKFILYKNVYTSILLAYQTSTLLNVLSFLSQSTCKRWPTFLVSQPSMVTSRGDYFFLLMLLFCKKAQKARKRYKN